MVSLPYEVIVVLDRCFGEKITALPFGSPVWIVGTPVNRAVVERLWKERPQESHLTGITVFNDSDGASAEDLFLSELNTIDLHHGIHSSDPPYTILQVYGAALTERIESELATFGFITFTSISGDFRAERSTPGETASPIMKGAEYEITACNPEDMNPAELETCFAIIGQGEAVNVDTMKRDLPRSNVLAIARKGTQIVGVGAIKPVRERYAAKVARNSGVDFPPETPELGYVAVDENHRQRGLSYLIVEVLASHHGARLFATTDAIGMKKALSKYGFEKKGKEWQGERGMLSYWQRV